jgi:UDP-N-acetylglucosamine--N-acetylmuramyl-(pentapeptide) pyrophosphoryl-undecaprenol N-acetylglucosamine transferase
VTDVLVAGGGTGGHLYPGLALADALAARGLAVAWAGTAGGLEARVVPGTPYPLHVLPGRPLRGGGVARAAAGAAAAARGVVAASRLLARLRPRLVVGVGGYASVAAVVAAKLRRLPTVLLEQNVVPGAATRALARVADRVCVGFAEARTVLPPAKVVHTGNPIRAAIAAVTPVAHDGVALLVFGGSAGAHRLNLATLDALRTLAPGTPGLRVTHQTGAADADAVRAAYAERGIAAHVVAFIDDMASAYAGADVVVARAGAMTCAEITATGLPAILVPYPYAADDHQRRNAEVLAAAGAAIVLLEPDCTGERLAATLGPLLRDAARRAAMAAASRALGRPDAAERVADACTSLLAG